jgi:hypothetical protein
MTPRSARPRLRLAASLGAVFFAHGWQKLRPNALNGHRRLFASVGVSRCRPCRLPPSLHRARREAPSCGRASSPCAECCTTATSLGRSSSCPPRQACSSRTALRAGLSWGCHELLLAAVGAWTLHASPTPAARPRPDRAQVSAAMTSGGGPAGAVPPPASGPRVTNAVRRSLSASCRTLAGSCADRASGLSGHSGQVSWSAGPSPPAPAAPRAAVPPCPGVRTMRQLSRARTAAPDRACSAAGRCCPHRLAGLQFQHGSSHRTSRPQVRRSARLRARPSPRLPPRRTSMAGPPRRLPRRPR